MSSVKETTPLNKARQAYLYSLETNGKSVCPCCSKKTVRYDYRFHQRLAEAVIKLVRVHERSGEWVHVRYVDPTRHLAKAYHWGLIEPKIDPVTKRRVEGYWRPTKKGNDFVYKVTKIPSHVSLLNNKAIGVSKKKTTVVEAVGGKTQYEELMAAL